MDNPQISRFEVALPKALHVRLKAICRQQCRSVVQVVRSLIERYVAEYDDQNKDAK